MLRLSLRAIAALAAVGIAGTLVGPDPASAQDVVKQRQDAMKGNGKSMKTIKDMIDAGKIDAMKAAAAAKDVNDTSKKIVGLFPAGSDMGETAALPAIWQQHAKFEATAKKLEMESAKLIQVVQAGDAGAIANQFKAVGGVCGECHEPFRKKKQ
ncbi:MAG: cytochrome c [Proteobacteria bacterium]|nr:cytochrome c [Pseudomonadota bacterium]